MVEHLAKIVWWLSGAVMLHTYVTYPASLFLFRRRSVVSTGNQGLPTVSILIAAHNEESCIRSKILNCLDLDYDPQKFDVVIGSDASTDHTVEIAQSIRDPRLRVIGFRERRGKAAVLNALVKESYGEILIFTDANAIIEEQGLRLIVRHFVDPQVGAVSGAKLIAIPQGASAIKGEVAYSDFENRLKKLESDIGGTSGCRGAFMARRRSDFVPFRDGAICDDMIAAIETISSRKRVIFDPDARAHEECGETVHDEFKRRIRIGAGNMQVLFWYPGILNPRLGITAYSLFSHKVIRWVFPFLMLGFLGATIMLRDKPVYRFFLYLQSAGYFAAIMGWMLNQMQVSLPLIRSAYHFVAMNFALLIGCIAFFLGKQKAAWERSPRTNPQSS